MISSSAHASSVRLVAATVLLLVVVTACADDDGSADEQPSSLPPSSSTLEETPQEEVEPDDPFDVPLCSEQWVEGGTVEAEFADGCTEGDTVIAAFPEECADGGLFVHSPRGYGIVGQLVHLPASGDDEPDTNSRQYQRVLLACNG